MAKFFIDRPVFAWVIALFILVLGSVAVVKLPVAQYPSVAPPSIVVSAVYPGASAQTLEDSVLSIIEQEMNGSPGLIYMESVAQANGSGSINLSFESGTHPDLAQVDVQNRLGRAAPRLPAAVTQQGVRVDKARSNFLLFTILSSENAEFDPVALGDYASRAVLLPQQAVTRSGQGDTVMVVDKDGKVTPRTIKVGSEQNGQWVVLDGLKAGEQVVVDGFQKMRPNAPVKPVPWSPGGAPAKPASAPSSAPASAAKS